MEWEAMRAAVSSQNMDHINFQAFPAARLGHSNTLLYTRPQTTHHHTFPKGTMSGRQMADPKPNTAERLPSSYGPHGQPNALASSFDESLLRPAYQPSYASFQSTTEQFSSSFDELVNLPDELPSNTSSWSTDRSQTPSQSAWDFTSSASTHMVIPPVDTKIAPSSLIVPPVVDPDEFDNITDEQWYRSVGPSPASPASTYPFGPLTPADIDAKESVARYDDGAPLFGGACAHKDSAVGLYTSGIPDLAEVPDLGTQYNATELVPQYSLLFSDHAPSGNTILQSESDTPPDLIPVIGPDGFIQDYAIQPHTTFNNPFSSPHDAHERSNSLTDNDDYRSITPETPARSITTQPDSTATAGAAHRLTRDAFLLEHRRAGISYKEIKRRGRFREAESTLRGRVRVLTKEKWQRVRKPEWFDDDVCPPFLMAAIQISAC